MNKQDLRQVLDDIDEAAERVRSNTNNLFLRRRAREIIDLCDKGRDLLREEWQLGPGGQQ